MSIGYFAIFSKLFLKWGMTMTLKERIKELCKSNKISVNKLETDLGFGTGYVSKLDKSTPNMSKLSQIADYFNVSTDMLLERETVPQPRTASEHIQLISLYEKLTEEQKQAILTIMSSMVK
jgi:transcriptional regulator with XRE-family HTH domain